MAAWILTIGRTENDSSEWGFGIRLQFGLRWSNSSGEVNRQRSWDLRSRVVQKGFLGMRHTILKVGIEGA